MQTHSSREIRTEVDEEQQTDADSTERSEQRVFSCFPNSLPLLLLLFLVVRGFLRDGKSWRGYGEYCQEKANGTIGHVHGWEDPKVAPIKMSFVNVVVFDKPTPKINFRSLVNEERVEDSDFVLPAEAITMAQNSFANSLVGYFVVRHVLINGGRLEFARALIELDYEWKPPLCLECHVFGHYPEQSPKRVTQPVVATAKGNNDGFTTVLNQKKKGKAWASAPNKMNEGVKMNKPKDESLGDKNIGETRGLNNDTKDAEPDPNSSDSKVKEMIMEPDPGTTKLKGANIPYPNVMCAILESHVDIATLSSICSKVFRAWDWTSNGRLCDTGCRIIIGWNMDVVDSMVLSQSSHAMHVQIRHKSTNSILQCLFIYVGSSQMNSAMLEFKDCVLKIKVMDINSTGLHFTWNQKPEGGDGILKKLDRIMGNIEFIDSFLGAYAIFQPYRISDHSPSVLFIDLLLLHLIIFFCGNHDWCRLIILSFHSIMDNQGNVSKREKMAGRDKCDYLRARIYQSQAKATKIIGTQPRRAIRVSQNPNASFEGPSDFECQSQIHNDSLQYEAMPGSTNETYETNKNMHASFSESMGILTMNPSYKKVLDVEEEAWSNKAVRDSLSHAKFNVSFNAKGQNVSPNYAAFNVSLIMLTNSPNTDIVKSLDINSKPVSYAGVAGESNSKQFKSKANFRSMVADKVFDGVNISISQKVVEKVSVRFENTLYGYFIGKRMAFPIVEYYDRNNWAKHGLKRIMMNAKGFFFFKFDTQAGLEFVLEGGPWMIHCVTIGIPSLMGDGFIKETIHVEYEWKPSRCENCKIFGHTSECCPKKVVNALVVNNTNNANTSNDGFQQVVNKKHNNKRNSTANKIPKGVPIAKGFQVGKEFNFQPKVPSTGPNGGGIHGEAPTAGFNGSGNHGQANSRVGSSKNTNVNNSSTKNDTSNDRQQEKDVVDSGIIKTSNIATPNPFAALGEDEDEEGEVKNIYDESKNLNIQKSHVDVAVVYDTCKKVCSWWKWTSNGILCPKDHSAGGYESNATMREFKECVQGMEVSDVNSTGLHFTWNQKPKGSNDILKKIDRIMEGFRKVIESGWALNVDECNMYRVVKRLKGLKSPFRKLLHAKGNLHNRVDLLRKELDETQKAIDKDPHNPDLREEHAHYLLAFKEASLDEERFLSQKSITEWLKAGDSNTAYFYKIVKSKRARNRIEMVRDASNILYEGNAVAGVFVCTMKTFLVLRAVLLPLRTKTCFVMSWTAKSKIIANRIKGNLDDIVCINQSAFVPGQRISNNILLTQELMRNYHRKRGPPRCAFKVDIQKADCKILVEKLKSRINDWRNKFLSIAGRLQLVISVLSPMHIYWASVFILPARIIHDLEQLMRGFLWCQDRFLGLSSIPVPNLIVDCDDVRLWRDSEGNLKPFSVACAWDSIRLRTDVVDWCGLRFVALLEWIKSPRFADISAYLIPSSKGSRLLSKLLLYGSFEAGYLQVQEGVYPVSSLIRSMKDSKLLYGSRRELRVRVVLFFPSLRFFPLAKLDKERFLKQKAKIEWLDVGDSNSAYFHKAVKSINKKSRIEVILNPDNIKVYGPSVPDVFVSHYEMFFGSNMPCANLNIDGILQNKVSGMSYLDMVKEISDDEIKIAMFDIGDDRAPGLDGFTFAFFKRGGTSLVRIRISDNILITQELMHYYHRNRGPPRCAFKVDIQKAYDTVDWKFLGKILKHFGFHPIMVKWIMTCVTSTSFSLSINGDIHRYFKGKRGLRQGDPISPYLFMLVMEVLMVVLKRKVSLSESFRYYKHCEELQLINICFADDLFIFARGDVDSAR
nr:hypothetical protein [Tanacetum cinerariifolium]